MRKIMLVIDEYQDLVTLENMLRRLGFDVLSLGKDILVNDALLKFTPEIVIATFKGRNVDGAKVSLRMLSLPKQAPAPRIALVYPAGSPPTLAPDIQAIVDAMIPLPFQAQNVIRVVAQMSDLEAGPLLGKFQKISSHRVDGVETVKVSGEVDTGNTPLSRFVTNEPKAPEIVEVDPWAKAELEWDPVKHRGEAANLRSVRSDRYDRFLSDNSGDDVSGVMPRERAQAAMKQLRRDSESEKESLEAIDREKREFVSALYIDDDKETTPKKNKN